MKGEVLRLITKNRHRKGQGLVEYALLAAFIALTVMIALGALGEKTFDLFTGLTGKLFEINSSR